jgi:hypothetical protein
MARSAKQPVASTIIQNCNFNAGHSDANLESIRILASALESNAKAILALSATFESKPMLTINGAK